MTAVRTRDGPSVDGPAEPAGDAPIVLVGFMASGKSAVGRLLAEALGRAFLDLDDLVAAEAGRPVASLVRREGEARFRAFESRVLRRALGVRGTVVASGGGVVLAPGNRRLLAARGGPVVWLRVGAAEALRRVRGSANADRPAGEGGRAGEAGRPDRPDHRDRPLLPATRDDTRRLLVAREPLYAEVATVAVDTERRAPEEVAGEVLRLLAGGGAADGAADGGGGLAAAGAAYRPAGHAKAGAAGGSGAPGPAPRAPSVLDGGPAGHGPVVVGAGLMARLADLPGFPRDGSGRAFVVSDPLVMGLYGDRVLGSLRAAGLETAVHLLPYGERAKTGPGLCRLWEDMSAQGLDRQGLVVSLGGGAVSDVAGLAAATFMRGLRVVHVPTTLLGQVDAAVGGKTAVNLRAGKNLAGVFHFPAMVAADTDALRTLPAGLVAEGLVEALKTVLVGGLPLDRLEAEAAAAAGMVAAAATGDSLRAGAGAVQSAARRDATLERLVGRAVRTKLAIVRADPWDRGRRAVLNLGHTFGHAIETEAGFGRVRHGLAVGVGVLAAVRLSEALGLLPAATAARLACLFAGVLAGFPARNRLAVAALPADRVLARLAADKKRLGDRARFVVLRPKGDAEAGGDRGGNAGPGAPALEAALIGDVPAASAEAALAWALGTIGTLEQRDKRRDTHIGRTRRELST